MLSPASVCRQGRKWLGSGRLQPREMGMGNLHWQMLLVCFFSPEHEVCLLNSLFPVPFFRMLSLLLVLLPLLLERTVPGSKAAPHLTLPGTCLCLMPPLPYSHRLWLSWVPELPMAMETGWQAAQGRALTGLSKTSAGSWGGGRERAAGVGEPALACGNCRS